MSSLVSATNFEILPELENSMMIRKGACCLSDHLAKMKQAVKPLLRLDAPGELLPHQLEDLCMMKALEIESNRGGLLCEPQGAGKTIISLVHALRNCLENQPILVLASKQLLEDVWLPQLLAWITDALYVLIHSKSDFDKKLLKLKGELGRQFILLNTDCMIRDSGLWSKVRNLNPRYIFIDEGDALGSSSKSANMVAGMQGENTLTWVVSATPFKDRSDPEKFAEGLKETLPHFDAITQRREKNKGLATRLKKTLTLFSNFGENNPGDEQKMDFVIRHSTKDLEKDIPAVKEREARFTTNEDRKKQFLRFIIKEVVKKDLQVLVAGMTKTERGEIAALLDLNDIKYCCLEKDGANAAKKFASEKVPVCLMSDNLKVGVDSLKVAQKIVFWSADHPDYAKPSLQTTIIKRCCRLGSPHKDKGINVIFFREEKEDDDEDDFEIVIDKPSKRALDESKPGSSSSPPCKKARVSDALALASPQDAD